MSNLNDIFFTPAANQELTYDQVLEDVQRYFAENHASTIAEAGEGNAERATSLLKELMGRIPFLPSTRNSPMCVWCSRNWRQ